MIAPAATLGPTAYWYLTRATGIVALLLLTGIVVLGVLGPAGIETSPRWPRFALVSLHRDLSLLAVAVIVIHVVTTVVDGFAPISLLDAVIPFHSAYRSLWLGLGAVAFDLIIALVITSLIRRRLGYRSWRAVHWLAYACWPIAVLHGLGTGSDSRQAWALALTFVCVVAVSSAVIIRLRRARVGSQPARALGVAAAAMTPVGLAIFTVLGPLSADWALRAGTPRSLLPGYVARPVADTDADTGGSTTASTDSVVRGNLALPFKARLAGTLTETELRGEEAIIDLELRLSGGPGGALRIRFGGREIDGAGVSLVGSQVALAVRGLSGALVGKIVRLSGTQVAARVGGAARPVDLLADLQVDGRTNTVTGTLFAQSG